MIVQFLFFYWIFKRPSAADIHTYQLNNVVFHGDHEQIEVALRLLYELHDVRVRFASDRFAVDADYAVTGAQARHTRWTLFPDMFHKYGVHRLVGTHAGTPSQAQPLVSGQNLRNTKRTMLWRK